MLGVLRASAGEMLKRLEKEGSIRRGEHKEALLTPAGRKRARRSSASTGSSSGS
jgi:Mn-dependent DtxR family transcriptional regulator